MEPFSVAYLKARTQYTMCPASTFLRFRKLNISHSVRFGIVVVNSCGTNCHYVCRGPLLFLIVFILRLSSVWRGDGRGEWMYAFCCFIWNLNVQYALIKKRLAPNLINQQMNASFHRYQMSSPVKCKALFKILIHDAQSHRIRTHRKQLVSNRFKIWSDFWY